MLFLDKKRFDMLLAKEGTPLCIYSEKGLRDTAKSLFGYFSDVQNLGFRFPVHVCPRKEILSVLADENVGAYCQTPEELDLALESGMAGSKIAYAAVVLPESTAKKLQEINATLLAASPAVLQGPLPRNVDLICSLRRTRQNGVTDIGYHRAHVGLTRDEVWKFVPELMEKNINIGLAVVESQNTTDVEHLGKKVNVLLRYAAEVSAATGAEIMRICPGEGPGFLYQRSVKTMDFAASAEHVAKAMEGREETLHLNMSRCLMEPCGIYVATVVDILYRGRPTLIVDATTEEMRVESVGRGRHMSIAGKEWIEGRQVCDVLGYMPTTQDWFSERAILPVAEIGDKVVFHDVGATVIPSANTTAYFYREDGTLEKLEHGEKQK